MDEIDNMMVRLHEILKEHRARKSHFITHKDIVLRLKELVSKREIELADLVGLLCISDGKDCERILERLVYGYAELRGLCLAVDEVEKLVASVGRG